MHKLKKTRNLVPFLAIISLDFNIFLIVFESEFSRFEQTSHTLLQRFQALTQKSTRALPIIFEK